MWAVAWSFTSGQTGWYRPILRGRRRRGVSLHLFTSSSAQQVDYLPPGWYGAITSTFSQWKNDHGRFLSVRRSSMKRKGGRYYTYPRHGLHFSFKWSFKWVIAKVWLTQVVQALLWDAFISWNFTTFPVNLHNSAFHIIDSLRSSTNWPTSHLPMYILLGRRREKAVRNVKQ